MMGAGMDVSKWKPIEHRTRKTQEIPAVLVILALFATLLLIFFFMGHNGV